MCAQEAEYSLCSGGKGALWFLSFQFRCQFSHDLTFPRYAYIKTLAVPPAFSLTHTQKGTLHTSALRAERTHIVHAGKQGGINLSEESVWFWMGLFICHVRIDENV